MLQIPCRRKNTTDYKGFETCEKVSFETEVITHSYVYWNTMLNNGDYGFGESCTCALIHAHFPKIQKDQEEEVPQLKVKIIQSLRRLADNDKVNERRIDRVMGHRRGFFRRRDDAPESDKQLIMNILSTNPAIIVMESLDDCETLFDYLKRTDISNEQKKRGVATVLFEIIKFTKYTRMRH